MLDFTSMRSPHTQLVHSCAAVLNAQIIKVLHSMDFSVTLLLHGALTCLSAAPEQSQH